ncbi:MAG TPA: hypothetical protein VGB87_12935, partial [Vicinamibacteria bacterium]
MLGRKAVVVGGLLLAATTALGVAAARREPDEAIRRPRLPVHRPEVTAVDDDVPGLVFRLGEGSEEGRPPALVARPAAERLSDADARRVIDRLPPLAGEPREAPFAFREGSLPPPRAGRAVRAAFPPEGDAIRPDARAAAPLEIVRRMPEGDVPLAPHLSITFSEPMVALDAHAGLAREAVPARLS